MKTTEQEYSELGISNDFMFKRILVNDLKDALIDARGREDWRGDYMTLLEREDELKREIREEYIGHLIEALKEIGAQDEDIIKQLIKRYELTREEAEECVREHV